MKIETFDLKAFGPFTERTLDFSEGDRGMHVVYGDNEAGKSTALRGLIALLYGIETRTKDDYIHNKKQMRLGGSLSLLDGSTLVFVRKKGNKNTLREEDEKTIIDDAMLDRFVHGVDKTLFKTLYAIDHEELVTGGRAILDQSGDLGKAMFSAALGTAGLRNVLESIEKSAAKLFRPGATKSTVINSDARELRETLKTVKGATLTISRWTKLKRALANEEKKLEEVEKQLTTLSTEKSKFQRAGRVLENLELRNRVREKLGELEDAVLLNESFPRDRHDTQRELRTARKALSRATEGLKQLEAKIDQLEIPADILSYAATIEQLHKDSGAAEEAVADRPSSDGKRRHLRNEAEAILKGIKPEANVEEVEELRPLLLNRKWIARLAADDKVLRQKEETTDEQLKDLEGERETLVEELQKIGEIEDVTGLKVAVSAANKGGNLDERLADAEQQLEQTREQCQVELERLGIYDGDLDGLERLSLPATETIDGFDERFRELADRRKERERHREELEQEQLSSEEELRVIQKTGSVATGDDLGRARARRQEGWQLIKRDWLERDDVAAAAREFCGDLELSEAYEHAVTRADDVADTLRLDAERVHAVAKISSRLETLTKKNEELDAKDIADKKRAAAVQDEWREEWAASGISPQSPREMRGWIRKAEKLRDRSEGLRRDHAEAEKTHREIDKHRETLNEQACAAGHDRAPDVPELQPLLAWAEDLVETAEARRSRKVQLEREISKCDTRVARAEEARKAASTKRDRWQADWEKAIEGLGVEGDAHPSQVEVLIEQLGNVFDKLDKAEDLRKRIWGIDKRISEFEEKTFDFADERGFDRGEATAYLVAEQLNQTLAKARESETSRKDIRARIEELELEAKGAEESIDELELRLADMRAQAGVASDEELEDAEGRSAERRKLELKLEDLEEQLLKAGDGHAIEVLESEAEGVDPDELPDRLQKLDSTLEEHKAERDRVRDSRNELRAELHDEDGGDSAAESADEVQRLIAKIRADVRRYLRETVAMLILRQQIERYRKENQTPVLQRASEVFSRLTLGQYEGLRDDLDDKDRHVLLGVRADGPEVEVGEMSDGTRDQLYLALRQATLEQHLESNAPMPFVVDDVLVGFDDKRTRACLETLAELAKKTQVLVFTHHEKVAELASALGPEEGVYVHRMEAGESS